MSQKYNRIKATLIVLLMLTLSNPAFTQTDSLSLHKGNPEDSSQLTLPNRKRERLVGYGSAGLYGGLLLVLNQAWYANYPRSSFHFYNDNAEWQQVDKIGHAWTANQLTRASYRIWKWTGVTDKKALTYAAINGVGFMTVIEVLDGFSREWGFSWGDMTANVVGSGLFLGQEALWREQRISYKYSFHKNNYREPDLEARANNLYGNSWHERMLKDYNAQTYWLSANLRSFFPESHLPKWLNISIGYGADGMFGGYTNEWTDKNNVAHNRSDIKRIRQFYIAPDIDLTRIKTKSKFLNSIFFCFNSLKIPAPAIMLDTRGKLKGYALYF